VQQFTILTVCTGNICRSPMAEQLLNAGLAGWPEIVVASSGSSALVGNGMPAEMQALSREFGGLRPEVHVARQLDVAQVREANLVLALSREHRRAIAELLPRSTRYTFTLREFARLVNGLSDDDLAPISEVPAHDLVGRLNALVEVAASRRGMVAPPEIPEDDDVIDPYRRPDEVYRQSVDQLVPAVSIILAQLDHAATVSSR
jgi:protein-tyrosine phosphatase